MRFMSYLTGMVICLISTQALSHTGLKVFRLNEGVDFEAVRTALKPRLVRGADEFDVVNKQLGNHEVNIVKYPVISKQTGQNQTEAAESVRTVEKRSYFNTAYFVPGELIESRYHYLVKAGSKEIFDDNSVVMQDFAREVIRRACDSPEQKPDARVGVLRAKRIHAPLKRQVSAMYGNKGAYCTLAKDGARLTDIVSLCRRLDKIRGEGIVQTTLPFAVASAAVPAPSAPIVDEDAFDDSESLSPSTQSINSSEDHQSSPPPMTRVESDDPAVSQLSQALMTPQMPGPLEDAFSSASGTAERGGNMPLPGALDTPHQSRIEERAASLPPSASRPQPPESRKRKRRASMDDEGACRSLAAELGVSERRPTKRQHIH